MKRSMVAGTGVVAAMVAMVVLAFAITGHAGAASHTLAATFPSASGLVPGSDVFEAGARVGTVQDIIPAPTGEQARVVMTITGDHWPMHKGLTVGIRPRGLLGEKYVDLQDGPGGGNALAEGAVLAADDKAVPVELDEFINSLDPQTRSSARTLLSDLGAGVAGRGRDLNVAIAAGREDLQHLAVTGQTLNNRDPELDRILVGLDGVLGRITTDDQLNQLSQLIDNGRTTLNTVESERAAFSRSFVDAQTSLAELNAALDGTIPSLRMTLDQAPALLGNLRVESDQLAQMASVVASDRFLPALVEGIRHGPTTTGGAIETRPDGTSSPIFRICLYVPTNPTSCTGHGFSAPPPNAAPASWNGGGDIAAMAALLAG
jgi:phospholipid/cholesterol/gamma-HCH transport system substrate-binding protein